MKQSTIILLTERVFRNLTILFGILLIALLVVFVHSCISPNIYKHITLKYERNELSITNVDRTPNDYNEYLSMDTKNVYYSKLTIKSKTQVTVFMLVPLFLMLLIMNEFSRFFKSVKNYSSFFINNARCFKWIGIYLIILVCWPFMSGIFFSKLSMVFPDGIKEIYIRSNLYINIGHIIGDVLLILLSFVASIVFKEGERLRVENELTI